MPINWEPTGRAVYFFTPHQDDEVLFMGQAIAHHVLAGREVHIVLMSNGSTSNVRAELNGTASDPTWWGGSHDPAHEGYAPLTQVQFGLARTVELLNAAAQLGVPEGRVHFGMDLPTSADLPDSVSAEYAGQVFSYWMGQETAAGRPAPGLYTMHWDDPHSDHAHCGDALRALRLGSSLYADSRWMVKPEQATTLAADEYAVPLALRSEAGWMVKRAAWAYGAWSPPVSFAIGMHSVGGPGGYFQEGPLKGAPNHIVRTP